MKLALIVMPSREQYARDSIMPGLPNATILNRPDLSLSDVHELAWESVLCDDFGVVLHDDIKLCNDFWKHLKAALDDASDHKYECVTLYSPRKADYDAMIKGNVWRRLAPSSFRGEECLAMHRDLILKYITWLDNGRLENRIWHDYQLSRFLMSVKTPVWIKIPNLVDHATDIMPSLVNHPPMIGGRKRMSTTWRETL